MGSQWKRKRRRSTAVSFLSWARGFDSLHPLVLRSQQSVALHAAGSIRKRRKCPICYRIVFSACSSQNALRLCWTRIDISLGGSSKYGERALCKRLGCGLRPGANAKHIVSLTSRFPAVAPCPDIACQSKYLPVAQQSCELQMQHIPRGGGPNSPVREFRRLPV